MGKDRDDRLEGRSRENGQRLALLRIDWRGLGRDPVLHEGSEVSRANLDEFVLR